MKMKKLIKKVKDELNHPEKLTKYTDLFIIPTLKGDFEENEYEHRKANKEI